METRRKRDGDPDGTECTIAELEEIHHLLDGFAQELRKLDEALETLSAYLLRLQSRPLAGGRTLH